MDLNFRENLVRSPRKMSVSLVMQDRSLPVISSELVIQASQLPEVLVWIVFARLCSYPPPSACGLLLLITHVIHSPLDGPTKILYDVHWLRAGIGILKKSVILVAILQGSKSIMH